MTCEAFDVIYLRVKGYFERAKKRLLEMKEMKNRKMDVIQEVNQNGTINPVISKPRLKLSPPIVQPKKIGILESVLKRIARNNEKEGVSSVSGIGRVKIDYGFLTKSKGCHYPFVENMGGFESEDDFQEMEDDTLYVNDLQALSR